MQCNACLVRTHVILRMLDVAFTVLLDQYVSSILKYWSCDGTCSCRTYGTIGLDVTFRLLWESRILSRCFGTFCYSGLVYSCLYTSDPVSFLVFCSCTAIQIHFHNCWGFLLKYLTSLSMIMVTALLLLLLLYLVLVRSLWLVLQLYIILKAGMLHSTIFPGSWVRMMTCLRTCWSTIYRSVSHSVSWF